MANFLAMLSGGGVIILIVVFFLTVGNLAGNYLSAPRQHLLRIVLFVLTGLAVLKFPLSVNGDVLLDQRAAILAVAAIFGGGPGLVATAAAMFAYRASIGGSTLQPALLGILFMTLVFSSVVYWRRRSGDQSVSIRLIVVTGIMAGLCAALILLFLLPAPASLELFQREAFGLFLVQVVSTCLFGFLLKLHIDRERNSDALRQKNIALHNALEQTVGALANAMSYRDPGIASHEKRVAELAVAIGAELHLEDARLEGLRLAALVHDIGKIQVPAEILMRPRKLSEEEFILVQLHAENGYQILKDVAFPWPLAEIVRQHHENYDGSGYPRGLKGEQILLEARILRVADSMEAMLSHQPFRRASDFNQAAASLQAGENASYDPEVVAACLRIFRDRHFHFPAQLKAA